MAVLKTGKNSRLYDFVAGTRAKSAEVDDEFNQLVQSENDTVDDLIAINNEVATHVGDAILPHPDSSVITAKIADGAVTDAKLGDRTVDQAIVTAANNTGTLAFLLSWVAKMIKAITGKANWNEAPVTTIEALNTELTNHKASTDHDSRYFTEAELVSIVDSDSGANKIGATPVPGIDGDSVQEVLEGLKLAIDVTQLGQIVDGSITDVKLSDEATNIKARFTEHTIDHHEHVVNIDGLTGGTATAYTVAVPIWSGIAFPRHGMTLRIKAHISCGDNPTLKVGDWAALDIIKQPLSAYTRAMTGDIIDDCYYTFMYDTSPAAWVIVGSKDADTVDGKHATDFVSAVDVVTAAEANKILKLDANGKLPANITGDANTVDGKNPGNGAGNILLLDTNARVPISNLSPIVGVAASKTFALTDAQTVQNCTNAAAITITIPTNATVAFAVGTELAIVRQGAGTVAIAPAAGVTLNSKDAKRSIDGQYASCALKKTATDTWLLVGALA